MSKKSAKTIGKKSAPRGAAAGDARARKSVQNLAAKPPRKTLAKPSTKPSSKTAKATGRSVKASASAPLPPRTPTEQRPVSRAAKAPQDKKLTARARPGPVVLPPDYRPSESEPFMNELQRAYFRQKLLSWKEDILRQTRETLAGLHDDSTQHADIADRATSETDRALELRARDRQRKLISKIDAALARIEDGTYGYCEETGEPIGLKRLDARPIATLSLEAQERHERREKVYREE